MSMRIGIVQMRTKGMARLSFWSRLLAVAGALILGRTTPGLACDEFASGLLANAIRPAIESMGCGALAQTGLDKAEHRLDSLCYKSSGPQSSIELKATLSCKTG